MLLPGRAVKTNEFIAIGVSAHEGTAVTYQWKLDNKGLTERFKKFWYTYNRPGVYHIEVNASNSNNSYTNNGIIVVQDPICGLKCVADTIAVMPMEETLIKWVINKGSVRIAFIFLTTQTAN